MSRWLLLDIGGVLEVTDDDAWPAIWAARWAERLGMTAEGLRSRLRAADLPDAATRSGVAEEYWRRTGDAVGADAELLASMRADFWDEYCGELDTELMDRLRGLRGRVGLALLSNSGDGAREEEDRRFGFASVFDPILYSHEIGVQKPDPEAFRVALEAMGAEPADVLFIDNHAPNTDAAAALGMSTHLHVSTRETLLEIDGWVSRGEEHG